MQIGVLGNEGSWYVADLTRAADTRGHKATRIDFPQIVAHRDFQIMQSLSPLYHIVEVNENNITCRDLRTRNFNTNFGRLDVVLDQEKNIVQSSLNV